MAISMQTLSDALKTYYLPSVIDQLNYKINPFFAEIEKNSEEVTGGKIVQAVRYGRNGGVGARSEEGTLPTPGNRKIKQAEFPTKNLFARISITDKMMKISNNDAGSFINALQQSLDDLLSDAKDNFSRQMFGNGTGRLATCVAASGVTTFGVNSVQYLSEGMFIDIMDNTNAVKVAGREILAIDPDAPTNPTITISGANVTNLVTDYIVISGAYNLELTGLDTVFQSTGLLYNIDRATNKWFTPNFLAINGEISEVKLQEGIDKAEQRVGANIDFFIGSYGVSRAYQFLMNSVKRNIDVMTLKGGWNVKFAA